MARRGRPPNPLKFRILTGNPGKRDFIPPDPTPAAGSTAMPSWLSPAAKTEWKRIVPELQKLGLLSRIDRASLASYCQAVAELETATKTLNREGRIVKEPIQNSKGKVIGRKLKTHPAVRLQRDAMQRLKQLIGEFGLSPASRLKVTAKSEAAFEAKQDTLSEIQKRVEAARQSAPPAAG